MAEYIDKKRFLDSMGLTGDETKYGNRDADHQHRSYSTYMSYEIMGSVEDSVVEEKLVPVVHGRWEEKFFTNDRQRVCSVCHCTVRQPSYDKGETALFNYCPHCGARMDGEVKT